MNYYIDNIGMYLFINDIGSNIIHTKTMNIF